MSSVPFTFLRLYWLLCSICQSWDLPLECTTPQPIPWINPTDPPGPNPRPPPHRLIASMDTNASQLSVSPSHTEPQWQIVCCNAIHIQYYTEGNDAPCGNLHDTTPSCVLNTDSKIEIINVRNCSLSGSIPVGFMYMTDLRILDIRDNALNGAIPSYFNRYDLFPNLQGLYIANNNIDGTIPFNIFQYPQLSRIDMHLNKRLHLDIPRLNLTASVALTNKPAIAVNFSFLHIHLDNDTDHSFYAFFETLRFSQFSMRSSVNNFTFIWRNKKGTERSNHEYRTIYATDVFDIDGNNMSGEFPCHFKSIPWEFYVANNGFTSWNITCYKSKHFKTLMLFQREHAYASMAHAYNQCYHDYTDWSMSNDYSEYYQYCMSPRAAPALKACCRNRSKPTAPPIPHPTDPNTHASNAPVLRWVLDNMEWILLLVTMSFVVCAVIIYSVWKRNAKYKDIKHEIEHTRTCTPPDRTTEFKDTTRKASTAADKESLLNGEESLLYGDF